MDKLVLRHFCISGAFSNAHSQAQPISLPHKQHWMHGSSVLTLYRVWGGRTARKCLGKGVLFYEGTEKLRKIMNTALLSQGLLPRNVA